MDDFTHDGATALTPQEQLAEVSLRIRAIEKTSARLKAAATADRAELIIALHGAIDMYVQVQGALLHLRFDAEYRNPVLRALAGCGSRLRHSLSCLSAR